MKLIENMKKIKEKNLNKIKNNNMHGITLIALVITIVILIILSGVAISLRLGNNGIFNKSKQAKENYMLAANEEQEMLANIDIDSLTQGGKTIQKVTDLKTQSTYFETKTTVEDSNGNLIKVPAGFKIASDSGDNVTEGIVIEDNDIIEGKGNNRGNQYVWIPVGTEIKKSDGKTVNITLGRYVFADGTTSYKDADGNTLLKGTPILKQNAENYLEEVVISSYKELASYNPGKASSGKDGLNRTFRGKQLSDGSYEGIKSFIDSVKANGGYYIARYEASYGTDGKANSKVSDSYTDSSTAPTTREEGMLWNHITQINAAIACENLYTTVNSDLINSYAWDTAIVYIQEFSGDPDYSRQDGKSINSSLTNTGANYQDEVCKINDMASNTVEWTTEYSATTDSSSAYPCTHRGSYYNYASLYTSSRSSRTTLFSDMINTFRSTLYM